MDFSREWLERLTLEVKQLDSITVIGGYGKDGELESIAPLTLFKGELYTIVGNTGSGKSRLIKDIEQLVNKDSVTGRQILLDGKTVGIEERSRLAGQLVAHLGQNMRFVLDINVEDFIQLHLQCRGCKKIPMEEVLEVANEITPEPIAPAQSLNMLSGGQTRALMIADMACICDSPVVLIDEIENAGIDKSKALRLLAQREKLVLIVTHDPHTALMAKRRIIMGNGTINFLVDRNKKEEQLFYQLEQDYACQLKLQKMLRKGEYLE